MRLESDYNPQSRQFLAWIPAIVLGILGLGAHFIELDFCRQGSDFTDSFYVYLLAAQFSHLSWPHLLLNLAGLAVVTWGFERQIMPLAMTAALSAGWLWVALWLRWVEPLQWYCGLSGLLHFQFTYCLVMALSVEYGRYSKARTISEGQFNWRELNWPLAIMVTGLLIKLWIEAHTGNQADSMIGGTVATQAHRAGVAGGLLWAAIWLAVARFISLRGNHDAL